MTESDIEISEQTRINLPPRIRMSTLYAVSQSHNGRVANTCNYSEDWVGYSTRYGDSVGDFSPLSDFTVEEVKATPVVEAPVVEEVKEETVDYSAMTLTELKEVAKAQGVKGYSKMKKEELINALN